MFLLGWRNRREYSILPEYELLEQEDKIQNCYSLPEGDTAGLYKDHVIF